MDGEREVKLPTTSAVVFNCSQAITSSEGGNTSLTASSHKSVLMGGRAG